MLHTGIETQRGTGFKRESRPNVGQGGSGAYGASNGNPTGNVDQPTLHADVDSYRNRDPKPNVGIPVSQVPQPPMQILPEPRNILHVSEPVQILVSQVPQPPMQILNVPVQIPVSQVPQSPVQIPPVQLLPELDMLDLLESTDAFDQLMSFVFGPQELQLLLTHVIGPVQHVILPVQHVIGAVQHVIGPVQHVICG
ncbi:hypothetical protein TNCV_3568171 [Trichonephila clavipes]|nr:hypothetical protein TNCV_3568171 [Trichonephila clavipes]